MSARGGYSRGKRFANIPLVRADINRTYADKSRQRKLAAKAVADVACCETCGSRLVENVCPLCGKI